MFLYYIYLILIATFLPMCETNRVVWHPMLFEVQHEILKRVTLDHRGYVCTILHWQAPTNVLPANWKPKFSILIIQSGLQTSPSHYTTKTTESKSDSTVCL